MKGETMPKFEEYMSNSRLTTMLYVTFIATTIGIKSSTKETIDWLLTDPKVLTSASDICRLRDDVASHQRERKEGNMVTSIDLYMKDKGASKEEALSAFGELAEDNWKHAFDCRLGEV
ncbi:hypothetical protein C2S52_006087 [Perilla frutescens var. hirtella]|nr:hypothetical protein C2S52_006087 [Perilla frutescens var. hirtella]